MSTLGDAFSRTWHSPKQLWRTYAPVLATPRVPRLLAGVLVGGLGSGLLPVGLVMMVSRHFGSLSRAGLLLAALGIGCATWPVLQGALFRVVDPRRCVVPLALAHAAAVGVLLATCTAPFVVTAAAAAVVAGACLPALPAVLRSAWPGLVGTDKDRLRAAFALDAGTFEALYLLGVACGAILLAFTDPVAMLITAMVGSVAGAALFASAGSLTPTSPSTSASPHRRTFTSWSLRLVVGWAPFGFAYGTFEVVAVAFSVGYPPATTGLLLVLVAVGSTLGALMYGARRHIAAPLRSAVLALVVAAGCLGLAALQQDVFTLGIVAVVLGAAFAPFAVGTTSALIASADGRAPNLVLWTMTLLLIGNAVGNAVSGAIVDVAGWRIAAVIAAVVVLLAVPAVAIHRRTRP